jgi:5'-deoxynucleotidase
MKKHAPLFPPELRTMSVVPRWSVVWTLTRDNLTNHSYYVAMYSYSIAKLINWQGDAGALLFRALTHDCEETVTGDLVSPVKSEILDDERAARFIDLKMNERLPYIVRELELLERNDDVGDDDTNEAWRIIKAADRLDALLFLITERRLGNQVISSHIPRSLIQTEAAFRALPAPPDELDKLWNTYMTPAIKEHEISGGMGIW